MEKYRNFGFTILLKPSGTGLEGASDLMKDTLRVSVMMGVITTPEYVKYFKSGLTMLVACQTIRNIL